MSKIVQAINSMIANKEKIAEVEVSRQGQGEEYFFKYNDKYLWSLALNEEGDYWFYYYPTTKNVAELASLNMFDGRAMVAYGDSDLRSREGRESAKELFEILKGRIYDIDSVLDDIIEDFDIPF